MLTLWLRKEPQGVAYYRDPKAKNRACLNSWPSAPDRRNRYVMFNCYRWRVVWLDDLGAT